jgi:hypothetical protein
MARKEVLITSAMLTLIIYTLSLSLISQAFPAGQRTKTLSSTGSIQIQTSEGIGIYSDYQCNTPLIEVPWGTLVPGESKPVICYIKNEGSSPITLSLETSNWTPGSASNYFNLNWDYTGQPINSDQVTQVTLILSVASNIAGITNFGFDITIIGN